MSDLHSFLVRTGWDSAVQKELAGDASSRHYYRLFRGDEVAILMQDPNREALKSYLAVTQILIERGYSVPEVFERDEANGFLILEDFGEALFARLLERGEDERALYELAVSYLLDVRGQTLPTGIKYFSNNYVMDQNAVFLDWYVPFLTGRTLDDNARLFFQQIWQELMGHFDQESEVLLHRDFHAENLFFLPERVGLRRLGLIDFQDAMVGPPAYDLVSLLQDARRDVTQTLAEDMITTYIEQSGENEEAFRRRYTILGAHRNMRILGIFTRLKEQEGKKRYEAFKPRVISHLNACLAHPDLMALRHWVRVTLGELL